MLKTIIHKELSMYFRNLNSIFQNIVLANDLELNYSTNSPTMLVTGMTVGGR